MYRVCTCLDGMGGEQTFYIKKKVGQEVTVGVETRVHCPGRIFPRYQVFSWDNYLSNLILFQPECNWNKLLLFFSLVNNKT